MTEATPDGARKVLTELAAQGHAHGVNDGFSLAIECLEAIYKDAGISQRIGLALGISSLKSSLSTVAQAFPNNKPQEGAEA